MYVDINSPYGQVTAESKKSCARVNGILAWPHYIKTYEPKIINKFKNEAFFIIIFLRISFFKLLKAQMFLIFIIKRGSFILMFLAFVAYLALS